MDAIPDLGPVGRATARLLATVATLDDDALRAPSLLPGWTRAHVLVHLARNADGMRNLLLAARTGARVWMYPAAAVRGHDIAAAADRPLDVVRADLDGASDRWRIEAEHLPAAAWGAPVTLGTGDAPGAVVPAARLVGMRLGEVEVHHVDLGLAYTFASTPPDGAAAAIDDVVRRMAVKGAELRVTSTDDDRTWGPGGGVAVRGSSAALLGWLTGRGDGAGCVAAGGGPLPTLPPL